MDRPAVTVDDDGDSAGICRTRQRGVSASQFFLAGQPRVQGGKYRSNKSPIPRKNVRFDPAIEPGTIVIETSKRRLYLTTGNGKAIEYAVGVGREGFEWAGTDEISRKAEWPGWTPPAVMRARFKREEGRILPAYVPGGPDNPLGARAMYIGSIASTASTAPTSHGPSARHVVRLHPHGQR